LLKEQYDVVVSYLPGSTQSAISLVLAKVFKKRSVIWNECWSNTYEYSTKPQIYRTFRKKYAKYILEKFDAIIVPGTASLTYHQRIGIPITKLFLANQSVKRIDQKTKRIISREELGIHQEYVILYLSRIINWKGLDILIKAFHLLEQKHNDVFLLIGGDGPYKFFCEDLSNKLKIKKIKFMGSIPNEKVNDYFDISDIFVLPSCIRVQSEAWGLVINEAMSLGKPIVTTDAVGAAEDLVHDGVNGYVVSNNNVDAMHLALKKMIDGGDHLIKEMGKNSLKIFNEFNDYNKMFSGFQKAITYSCKKTILKK
jgi:glycosyltransferase involved in cell wall biosynthesis